MENNEQPELWGASDEDAEGSSDYESTSESGDEYSEEENAVAGPSGTQAHANGTPALLGDAEDAEDTQVETAIEGDFDRLIQNIRDAGDGSSSGMLNKMWDMDLEEREAEFKDDLREASGVGKMKKKRGRRRGPVLSQQVRALIGEGNQAFVDADLHETVRIMQEVIRIEPRAAAPWSVLAQCYDDWGERMKALQLRIMAAHLNHDPDEWAELAQKSRTLGYNQQALYCYGKMYHLDPTNVNALWDRASLAKEIGDLKTARSTMLAMLKRLPHHLPVLEELRPILIELSDFTLCADLFQRAFDHYRAAFPAGLGLDAETGKEVPGGGFGLMSLLVLADLYNTLGAHAQAVDTIRRGCRWLQGRAAQKFWDACEDDREWDVVENGVQRGGEGEVQPGMYPLDVNARHRLAIARIKGGDVEEGKMHAKIVLAQDTAEYSALFSEIADAYFEREMYAEAGHIYEMLGGDAGTSSMYVLLQAAACRRMIGDLKEAAEVYEHVIQADPGHNEAKMKLAEIYEILNEPRKALDLVMQVIDSRKRRAAQRDGTVDSGGGDPASASLFEEGKVRGAKAKGTPAKANPNKLTVTQLRELETQKEREGVQSWHRVQELYARMLAGEEEATREWLVEAEKLVESFRETRALFLTSRHRGFRGMFPRSARKQTTEASEDSMASRLQLELGRDTLTRKGAKAENVNTFRTIPFDDWLRLFMHYAFLLTRRGQYEPANEVLRHLLFSNAFQSRSSQDSIRLALITCAIHADQFQTVVEQARKLINGHQFNNEPIRLLVASLGSGLRATDAFLVSTLSKHLLRETRLADAAVKDPEALRYNTAQRRYGVVGSAIKADPDDIPDDEDEVETPAAVAEFEHAKLPTKANPVNVAVYGQILLAAKSYQSALFYLLQAYDYAPDDPLVSLCLAIASVGRAMQRQSDNRHHLITQGMAFLTRYRELRGETAEGLDEVEYNFGRVFHQLGLHTLAVRHYERVLSAAEARANANDEDCGLAREAAHNLSLIYVSTGAAPLAQALYRRWLSL
ncbi:TPR-like protein [Trametes versicolor FP-101664 SS1]|uniref:TPR-like protein n=1 Tax=Trametes versicolor (strain FP-101664) TaxID=717944 RepID=UPI0004622E17|nr:TPR-like protein [Trametes versicolor FP-101664 SS1]EIW58576.1 TPR-like protein [Trametes versicolor FP-101664 SS1]